MLRSLVGSEMCIRDRQWIDQCSYPPIIPLDLPGTAINGTERQFVPHKAPNSSTAGVHFVDSTSQAQRNETASESRLWSSSPHQEKRRLLADGAETLFKRSLVTSARTATQKQRCNHLRHLSCICYSGYSARPPYARNNRHLVCCLYAPTAEIYRHDHS